MGYLAKAYFGLQEYEQCCAVLGDAMQIWPDDMLLRYNLAAALESFGVHLVQAEKATKRVAGVNNAMDHMERAIELLSSAARLYGFVQVFWEQLPDDERKLFAKASGMRDVASLLEQ